MLYGKPPKRGTLRKTAAARKKKPRLTEEDPNWNPYTMGNKRGGGAYYYHKSHDGSRPD